MESFECFSVFSVFSVFRVFRGQLSFPGLFDAAYLGAECRQFSLNVLVAAIQVVDAIHDDLALRHQPGDHEIG